MQLSRGFLRGGSKGEGSKFLQIGLIMQASGVQKQNLTFLMHSFIQQISQIHHTTPSPLPMFSLVCINEPRIISAGARRILISNYPLCIALIISLVLGESYSETQFYFLSLLKYSDVLNKIISSSLSLFLSFFHATGFPWIYSPSPSLQTPFPH